MSLFNKNNAWGPFAAFALCAATLDAAPIRVGIFTGEGPGRFWHTATHTAANALVSILAAPGTSNLGPNLTLYSDGLAVKRYGLTTGTGTTTPEQRQAFIDALDTTDVIVLINNIEIGNIFSDSSHRKKLEAFSRTKGVVSHHQTLDTYGQWPAWDSVQGARFQTHPSSDREATLHLDTVSVNDPHRTFLNRGLPDTARFLEEWHTFTTSGDSIRSVSGLKVTVRIDEASYEGGLGGAPAMGADHPMSWYRTFPGGGRFFFTALGHRAQTFLDNGGTPSTPFVRRQLYNAILWAAGVDSTGTVVSVADRAPVARARFADHARVTFAAGVLTVSRLQDEPASVEVLGVDGRRLAFRRHAAGGETTFSNLTPGVRLVVVTSPAGRSTRLVTIP